MGETRQTVTLTDPGLSGGVPESDYNIVVCIPSTNMTGNLTFENDVESTNIATGYTFTFLVPIHCNVNSLCVQSPDVDGGILSTSGSENYSFIVTGGSTESGGAQADYVAKIAAGGQISYDTPFEVAAGTVLRLVARSDHNPFSAGMVMTLTLGVIL